MRGQSNPDKHFKKEYSKSPTRSKSPGRFQRAPYVAAPLTGQI